MHSYLAPRVINLSMDVLFLYFCDLHFDGYVCRYDLLHSEYISGSLYDRSVAEWALRP